MSEPAAHFYEFGPFRLDVSEQLLSRAGVTVPLTPKAFETLVALVAHGGRVIEKEKLMEQVWPGTFVEEGNLSVTVFMLRQALAEGRDEQKFIETVPKRGYRYVAPVRKVRRDGAEPSGDQPQQSSLPPRPGEARRVIDHLCQLSQSCYVSPYYIAAIHAALGDKDEAFDWLRRACDNRSEGVIWLALDPTLDSLRTEPRFSRLMQRVGLE